jgi:MOSC domain-containing protein YiiM
MAHVRAVCVVHEIIEGYYHPSAIDKRPVDGPVEIDETGPVGDRHVDSHHGGPDAAVYVYADEDAEHFEALLQRQIPPGHFGENVRVTGLDVTGARLGEWWRIGAPGRGVLLEVRKPRTPCHNFSMRMGIDGFHVDFNSTGRVGAMCKVLEPGTIGAGDAVSVEHRPDHDVSIGALVTGMTPQQARGLLASDARLTSAVRSKARRAAARG